MLQPNTEAVELMPKGDYFLVTSILKETPTEPALKEKEPSKQEETAKEEAFPLPPEEGPTTYAFSSISHPSTSTPTSTPIFSHASPSLSTLSDCDTVYKTFQYAVREFPSNNCLGTLSPLSPPTLSFTSFSDTAALINTVATAFHDLSLVQPNEEGLKLLGIFSKNSPDWIIAEQAAYSNGAAVVPLYSTLGPQALLYILNQTQLETVICDSSTSAKTLIDIKSANPELLLKTIIISTDAPSSLPSPPPSLQLLPFSALLSHKSQYVFNPTPPTANDLATICYTSGTTGNPKGVLLTHRNFVAIAANALSLISISSTDVHFSYLPLAHIFERTMQVGLYHQGASVVFSSGNIKTLTDELKVASPTVFIAVPRVLSKFQDGIMAKVAQADAMKQTVFKTAVDQKIANLASNTLEHPQWDSMVFSRVKDNLGLSRVRFVLTGGASISPALKNFFRAILGVPVLEGYGQTECCAALSLTSILDHSTSGHVGVPLPCCKVKLESVEAMGYLCTDTEHEGETVLGRGEICVKSPGNFLGYYKRPAETAAVLDSDGFLHTGDIGAFTSSGQLKIIDRKKDLFKLSQGEYVSPEKVENVISSSPLIAQAFVWGLDTESYPVAVIIPNPSPNPPSIPDILKSISDVSKAQGLNSFEIPLKIHLDKVPFLPNNDLLTPTMKLKRFNLTNKYGEILKALYAAPVVERTPTPPPPPNMWKNQPNLPRLPVPPLEHTMKLYLEVAEALVTPEEFKATSAAAKSFLTGDGPVLQEKLKLIDDKAPDSSWFAGFHHEMYMNARYPGYVYKNPAGVCKSTLFEKCNITGQIDRASHLICATLVFAEQVMSETLEPDVFKSFPLDMLQYPRMFGCTRLPGVAKDSMVKWEGEEAPNHIIVIQEGKFWKVDFGNEKGKDVNVTKVKASLQAIISKGKKAGGPSQAVGALTCDTRDVWAKNRARLVEIDARNASALKDIDEALFVVCLDSETPTEEVTELQVAMKAAVHGNPRHRWFDKPCTIIVTAEGTMCSNCEHSWGDGIAMMRWGQELAKEIMKPTYKNEEVKTDSAGLMMKAMSDPAIMAVMANPRARPLAAKIKANPAILLGGAAAFAEEFAADPELAVMFKSIAPNIMGLLAEVQSSKSYGMGELRFELDSAMEAEIDRAGKNADELATSTKRSILKFDQFGAALLKKNGLSPDAVMQQALMLAYMKRHGKFVSSYCVAQHMAFKAGRNERMRSCTLPAKKFVTAAMESAVSKKDLFDLLKASCERHSSISRGCVMGMGFDRHLYALCQLSKENGEGKVPALFEDKAFVEMMTDTLCSSMLSGDFVEVMMASPAFGDLADDGGSDEDSKRGKYFVPYSTFNDHVTFFVNGFEPEDMDGMRDAIAESLEFIGKLLQKDEEVDEDELAKAQAAAAGRKRTHTVHHSRAAPASLEVDNELAKAEAAAAARSRTHTVEHSQVGPAIADLEDELEKAQAANATRTRTHTVGHSQVAPAVADLEDELGKAQAAAAGRKRAHTIHHSSAGNAVKEQMKAVMAKAMSDPEILAVMMNPKCKPIADKIMKDPSILAGGPEAFKEEFAADPSLATLFMGIAGKLKALMESAKGEGNGEVKVEKVVEEEENAEEEKVDVPEIKTGDNISSIYGEGEIEEVRPDGTCVFTLKNWELAYGSKVKCYLNPAAVTKK